MTGPTPIFVHAAIDTIREATTIPDAMRWGFIALADIAALHTWCDGDAIERDRRLVEGEVQQRIAQLLAEDSP